MELTIEQALEQGVAAHKEGNLQDAERLYRAILQTQPLHPDANHNLGVLAVSVGKPLEAVPLFKRALDANPQIEQFWLSYVDALTKLERVDEVEQVLADAKKAGLDSEKLAVLYRQLQQACQVVNKKVRTGLTVSERRKQLAEKKKSRKSARQEVPAGTAPSQDQIDSLMDCYQAERLDDAEILARSLTKKFPEHPFAWKVLGSALKLKGNFDGAKNAHEKVLQLTPDDAEVHNNLGNTLVHLRKLEEAEACYKGAIALNENYTEAYNNLAITLLEMGRLNEAEANCRKALGQNPEYADAYATLGRLLITQKKFSDAEIFLRRSVDLNPESVESINSLALLLCQLGKEAEARRLLESALVEDPNSAASLINLAILEKDLGKYAEAERLLRLAIERQPNVGESNFNLGLLLYEMYRYDEALQFLEVSDAKLARHFKLKCLFHLQQKALFYMQLDDLKSANDPSPIVGSLTSRAEISFGIPKHNIFANDPLKYVWQRPLLDKLNFEKSFAGPLIKTLTLGLAADRFQGHLFNGQQTSGNLFDMNLDFMSGVALVINNQIAAYLEKFAGNEEGFLRCWPSQYDLVGWVVRMQSGGHLSPHIHETGWISGTVYLRIPKKRQPNEGNLVLSTGEESDETAGRKHKTKIVDVNTGDIVLFPASLSHYTIPFESDEERIVLAFDVKPRDCVTER